MKQDEFLNHMLPLQPRMQLIAERILGDEAEAEDIVQEVFATLWEKRNKLDSLINMEGYAMRTLRNQCLDVVRRHHPTTSLDELCDISDDDARAESALTEERATQLDRMMQQLPEVQRHAVEMRYIKQLSHEEMQRRLKMSSSNVYTTLSRAISALKAMRHGR